MYTNQIFSIIILKCGADKKTDIAIVVYTMQSSYLTDCVSDVLDCVSDVLPRRIHRVHLVQGVSHNDCRR